MKRLLWLVLAALATTACEPRVAQKNSPVNFRVTRYYLRDAVSGKCLRVDVAKYDYVRVVGDAYCGGASESTR